MMTTTKTTCDHCQRDLTYTRNSEEWRILLRSELIPTNPKGGSVTDMCFDPPFDAPHHFCHVRCLTEFLTQPRTL